MRSLAQKNDKFVEITLFCFVKHIKTSSILLLLSQKVCFLINLVFKNSSKFFLFKPALNTTLNLYFKFFLCLIIQITNHKSTFICFATLIL